MLHTFRIWLEKQELAHTAWLNALLVPGASAQGLERNLGASAACWDDETGVSDARAVAKVRGLLWRMYSRDSIMCKALTTVEERINNGTLRLLSEVRQKGFSACSTLWPS